MRNNKKLIVFDMDGVLIDVSQSYRETVRQTAELFFKNAVSGNTLPRPLFTLADLATVKQSGGLNNDWDLTYLVIDLLFSKVEKAPFKFETDPWNTYTKTVRRCDVSTLVRFLKSTQNPLQVLFETFGRPTDPFIRYCYRNDIGQGNIIKQIFQEVYLGKTRFSATYHMPAKVFHGDGLIVRERLLADPSILAALSQHHILAIATGRPASEADYPLDVFDLRKYFQLILTLDDCLRQEKNIRVREGKEMILSKPNPFMLDTIAKKVNAKVNQRYYVGDMPDDMVAASRSAFAFCGIGILFSAVDKDNLRRALTAAGAKRIVDDFKALEGLLAR
jgi:HAD superfamily phosphatase